MLALPEHDDDEEDIDEVAYDIYRIQLRVLLQHQKLNVQSLRERNVVTCAGIITPDQSPWHVMYAKRDSGTFVTTISLDPDTFDNLATQFAKYYIVRSGFGKRGRPPKLASKRTVLALLLHFYTAAVDPKVLCELFGVHTSTFSRVLKMGEEALDKTLRHMDEARVEYPPITTQQYWAFLTNQKEPSVKGVFGFLDGKNYDVMAPTPLDKQNAYYNGTM